MCDPIPSFRFLLFDLEKIGLLMQSVIAKSDGITSDLRIRWPKSSGFGPNSDDSAHRILKSKNGIAIYSSENLTEQTLVQQHRSTR